MNNISSGGELHQRYPIRMRSKQSEALEHCNIDYPVFCQDEVGIHLNAKIGADLSYKSKQSKVATVSQNKKYFLAGALHSQTSQISYVEGHRKTTDLFLEKLKNMPKRLRSSWTTTSSIRVNG